MHALERVDVHLMLRYPRTGTSTTLRRAVVPSLGGLDSALSPSRAAPHWYDSSSPLLIVALRAAARDTALGLVGRIQTCQRSLVDQDTLVCAVLTELDAGVEVLTAQLSTSRTALAQYVVIYCYRCHGHEWRRVPWARSCCVVRWCCGGCGVLVLVPSRSRDACSAVLLQASM